MENARIRSCTILEVFVFLFLDNNISHLYVLKGSQTHRRGDGPTSGVKAIHIPIKGKKTYKSQQCDTISGKGKAMVEGSGVDINER